MKSLLGLAGFQLRARFDVPEWDELGALEPARLMVLAERTGQPFEPSGAPLEEAIAALRAHAERQAVPHAASAAPTVPHSGGGVVRALRERLRR